MKFVFFCMNIFPQDGHFHSVFLIPSPFSYPLHNWPPRWTLTRTRAYSGSRPFCFLLLLPLRWTFTHARTCSGLPGQQFCLFYPPPLSLFTSFAPPVAHELNFLESACGAKNAKRGKGRVIEERKWPLPVDLNEETTLG